MATRRAFIQFLTVAGAAGVATACSPATPPPAPTSVPKPAAATAAPATTNPNAAWDTLLAAGRKEGSVTIATYAGTAQRKVMDAFEAAYPGIKVEQTPFQSSSRDYVPRLLQERSAGLYLWDLALVPSQEMLIQVRPAGGLQPLRPTLILPDILDDKYWNDGFEGGFPDTERRWGYGLMRSRYQTVYVNTDLVKEGEVTRFADLLNPKWKGKITAGDPRTKGSGFLAATAMRIKAGTNEVLKDLYVAQEVLLGTDARLLTESMARGKFAIGIGAVDDLILKDFMAQGVGANLKNVPMVETDYVNTANKTAWFINQAPHPSAAAVFLNWITSRAGSLAYSNIVEDNSRRSDVPPFSPQTALVKGVDYVFLDAEERLPDIEQTQKLLKDLIN